MRMGQGVRTGLGHGGITCVLQTRFSSFAWDSKVAAVTKISAEHENDNISITA